jgi:dTDP-4-amino-4,6-dideoxygalactose transaminase
LGYNYRIDEIRSAIGIEQLHKVSGGNQRRRQITEQYREQLHCLTPEIQIPFCTQRGESACHLFAILLPREVNRTAFMEKLKEAGIQTSIHYPPIHQFSHYRGRYDPSQPLTVTEAVAARQVTLPLYPGLTDEDVEYITSTVQKAIKSIPAAEPASK